ncbi:hypothetical protein [Qingshengfaniella alkalisoli]|uniref:Uncharacterized protein n=1 Tax=Qingshengfaniella alkalisoli TaxID=2599296 RepID=A0A5B8I9H2_9RHOB|nr:hypothetical protein [Qingshengfaniella alkalisoli]QDY70925.1 hypothetical protein FPZ52_14595 [Qingshengfaniella alkalisoli]
MGTSDLKDIKVTMKVDPTKEVDDKLGKWLKEQPKAKSMLKPIEAKAKLAVDPRKWNDKKITDAMYAGARMEFQIFAQRVHDIKTAVEKGKKKPGDVEGDLKKAYDKLKRYASVAAEDTAKEIEADKGDNAKALRQGKAALREAAKVDFGKVFSGPRSLTIDALNDAAKAAADDSGKAGGNAPAKGRTSTDKRIDTAQSDFRKSGKNAEAAIEYLVKMAKDTAKNKDASPLLRSFAEDIRKAQKAGLDKFASALGLFGKLLDQAEAEMNDPKKTARTCTKIVGELEKFKSVDTVSQKAGTTIKKLEADFRKIEKELK